MTEDGDSDDGHNDENDDDDCNGDSIVVDDDIHDGRTADVEAVCERAVLLRYLTIDMQMKNTSCLIVLYKSWVLTLGVQASGRSMEVGHSVEVRHKFVSNLSQKHHFILKQTLDRSSITGPQSVVNFYLGLYFPSSYYW